MENRAHFQILICWSFLLFSRFSRLYRDFFRKVAGLVYKLDHSPELRRRCTSFRCVRTRPSAPESMQISACSNTWPSWSTARSTGMALSTSKASTGRSPEPKSINRSGSVSASTPWSTAWENPCSSCSRREVDFDAIWSGLLLQILRIFRRIPWESIC